MASSERSQEASVYVGNLDEKVTEALIWELFVQVGPVVNVFFPRDKISKLHQNYGFVEFQSEQDADYATKIMNMVKLYGKPIRVNRASADKSMDIGATLFIGNLDPEVDERMLYDTFGAFGNILQSKVTRDTESALQKGYGFVSFDSFESADAAMETMNGQYICNRPISVSYAFKKDTNGERHGSAAERMLATQGRLKQITPSVPQ